MEIRTRSIRSRYAALFVGLLALGGTFGVALPASAAPTYSCSQALACPKFSGTGVNIRENPLGASGSHTILGEGQTGQKFAVVEAVNCLQDESGDYWWDYGTDTSTGITGWASDYYVSRWALDNYGGC